MRRLTTDERGNQVLAWPFFVASAVCRLDLTDYILKARGFIGYLPKRVGTIWVNGFRYDCNFDLVKSLDESLVVRSLEIGIYETKQDLPLNEFVWVTMVHG